MTHIIFVNTMLFILGMILGASLALLAIVKDQEDVMVGRVIDQKKDVIGKITILTIEDKHTKEIYTIPIEGTDQDFKNKYVTINVTATKLTSSSEPSVSE